MSTPKLLQTVNLAKGHGQGYDRGSTTSHWSLAPAGSGVGPNTLTIVIPVVMIATNSKNVTLDGKRIAAKLICPENAINFLLIYGLLQACIPADHGNLDLGQILLEEGRPVLEPIGQGRDEIGFPVIG